MQISDKKISVITVTKNSGKYIEKALSSVITQTYKNIELIVIDGCSTDNTLEIIRKYESNIDTWISEPDGGIAEAMNKGVELATGDYLVFINSDDYLLDDDVLQRASAHLQSNRDIYIFKVLFLYPDGRKASSLIYSFGILTNYKMGSCHQGQLISRDLLEELGKLDETLKINFDYDFILRAYRSGASSQSVDMTLSVMRQVGISSRRDWVGFKQRYDEERLVHFKNCPDYFWHVLYRLYWIIYIPYRYVRYGMIYLNSKYIKNKTIKSLQ